MSAGPESARGLTLGICEMTLEARDPWSPGAKEFGDQGGRHVHFALSVAPERLDEVVAAGDFFEHGDGAREGVGALEGDGAAA